jgi:copper resistance protein B
MTMLITTARARRMRVLALGSSLACVAAGAMAQPAPHESAPAGLPAHAMLEDPFNRAVLFDQLEGQDVDGGTNLTWDVSMWAGHAFNRLAVRSEGNENDGTTEHAELQLLWAHTVARWWDVVAGAREDFAPGPSRGWAAFGVQGLAPYRFDLEATAFVGDGGDLAARLAAEYELLITNRWILQPRVELNWYGQEDALRALGPGLSSADVALRLRYEIRREIAPYVGIVRERKYGGTADFAEAAGEGSRDTRWVAGIRLRF